ncbi:MAG: hypothetical protein EOO13_16760 [Chitinophagaceae bacterium]|nr:MAG: hypothetical protein EOO13_16760 [Chitinophagaceae bacterium]
MNVGFPVGPGNGIRGIKKAHGTAQDLLVGRHPYPNGRMNIVYRVVEAVTGFFFLVAAGNGLGNKGEHNGKKEQDTRQNGSAKGFCCTRFFSDERQSGW